MIRVQQNEAVTEVVIAGGQRVHLRPWRCSNCGKTIADYAFTGGVLVLQRNKCPYCGVAQLLVVQDVA